MIGVNIFNENRTWKDWAVISAVVVVVLAVGYLMLMPSQVERADMTAPPAGNEYSTPPAAETAPPEAAPAPAPQN